jgi:hypothetical protein
VSDRGDHSGRVRRIEHVMGLPVSVDVRRCAAGIGGHVRFPCARW